MSLAALSTRRRCNIFFGGTADEPLPNDHQVGDGLGALYRPWLRRARDPSMWWVAGVLGCLIGLLLTACVGAIYRTGRERVFWRGIVVFGGGYLLLAQILSSDGTGNPVAIINRVLDWADISNLLLTRAIHGHN